jgi:hypothetical protein
MSRTSLGVGREHAVALRAVALDVEELNLRGVLEAIIEGNEDIWRAVVKEFKRRQGRGKNGSR